MYVNPGRGVFFKESSVAVHGTHLSDPHIVNASEMRVVWHTFCEWVDSHEPDETIILVAVEVEADTSSLFLIYNLPTKIKWFMDPLKFITSYGSCPLNKDRSKLDSHELGDCGLTFMGGT